MEITTFVIVGFVFLFACG